MKATEFILPDDLDGAPVPPADPVVARVKRVYPNTDEGEMLRLIARSYDHECMAEAGLTFDRYLSPDDDGRCGWVVSDRLRAMITRICNTAISPHVILVGYTRTTNNPGDTLPVLHRKGRPAPPAKPARTAEQKTRQEHDASWALDNARAATKFWRTVALLSVAAHAIYFMVG